jgi:hypothetical protein
MKVTRNYKIRNKTNYKIHKQYYEIVAELNVY